MECEARDQRELSRPSFVRVVKFLMPTLHLGRTKTDVCNACFSLDLQIKNPETSEALKHELKEAKKVHLDEAIVTRRAINKLVKSVKEEVAPSDPPFLEEPIYIPQCVKDQSVANIFLGSEYEYEYIRNILFNTNTNTNIFGINFWTKYEYEYIRKHQVDRIRIFEYFWLKYSNII